MSSKSNTSLGRRVTSYDVAVAAGVAQSTVSRCFQPESEMAAATRERVRAIAADLGYVPNALARSLITRRSNMVAVIVTEFTLRANPAIVGGIGGALAQRGKHLLLFAVDADRDAAAKEAAEAALTYPLDGLIVAALLDEAQIRPFLQRGVPVVFFNRPAALPQVDRVATDHAEAAREVARRLHAAGHRRFACLAGPDWPVNRERVDGFRAGLSELGVAEVAILLSGPDYDGGRTAFLAHARAHGAPDAVFCVTDPLAFGVLDCCRFDLGLAVPRDLSVIGFDDVAEAAHQSYDLTTVRQAIGDLATAAVEMLARRMEAPHGKARRVLLPGVLVERGSARV